MAKMREQKKVVLPEAETVQGEGHAEVEADLGPSQSCQQSLCLYALQSLCLAVIMYRCVARTGPTIFIRAVLFIRSLDLCSLSQSLPNADGTMARCNSE